MTTSPYSVRTLRAANLCSAKRERLESADGSRWATSRVVKMQIGGGIWEPVEMWTLKARVGGKAVVREQYATQDDAEGWVR